MGLCTGGAPPREVDVNTAETPAAVAVADSAWLEPATQRLLGTAAGLSDEQIAEPSLLPGWTRGHVLTHLARNADAMARVVDGASEGRVASFYDSEEARDRDIQQGAPRPAAEQLEDVRTSAARLAEAVAAMPDDAWGFEVPLRGRVMAVATLPWRRVCELEYHHTDLDAGYTPALWEAEFVSRELGRVAGRFAGEDIPGITVRDSHSGAEYTIGRADDGHYTVVGPARALLAWLSGRASADGLTAHHGEERLTDPRQELPALPPMA
jgi:maleylpyruvate isomerase